jgi:hypothetical protein
MIPLAINVSQCGLLEGIGENIKHSLSLGLPELQFGLLTHDGTFVLCASGPSIEFHVDEIRADQAAGKTICAVKGAYDFLRGHGITPDLYLSVEPRYKPVLNPAQETSFLLASRCHPQLFEDLKSHRVYVWHSWSVEDGTEHLIGKPLVGGGTTSGLRSVNVGYLLGFRKFKWYGMDSSLGLKGEKRVGQDPLGSDVKQVEVFVGEDDPKGYITNMAMGAQAQEAQTIYSVMPDITIDVIGSGLIPAIWEQRKLRGMHC